MALLRLDPVVKHWSGFTPFTQSCRIGLANVKFGQEFCNSNLAAAQPLSRAVKPPQTSPATARKPTLQGQANHGDLCPPL
ncbi:hypothetical protein PGT21_017744 [Puccinia graminis f. sp. tritici]|uniref:Uncharacterized protein n=1 Tax=Puccinia graminis f. sp. tritici TaxID=56615 RepID=A0A5B0QFQ5_PUCGR|nr:hypothetical protein PGT21_017744 [Puccinia graminis f. sp. tritici]